MSGTDDACRAESFKTPHRLAAESGDDADDASVQRARAAIDERNSAGESHGVAKPQVTSLRRVRVSGK